MKVSTILDQIDNGAIALPVFQRGYVWNRDQVRGLMESLYRRHPVGSLLTWVTRTENVNSRGDSPLHPGYVKTPAGWSAAHNNPLRHHPGQGSPILRGKP